MTDGNQQRARGMHILIVDDSDINCRILARMVTAAGGRAAIARNGLEAVEYLQAHRPDLVFMDLSMPVMDGFEATRRIRALYGAEELPIYAASANVTEQYQAQCARDGFNAFLPKPVRRDAIAKLVVG